ncbi:MAG: hypothetical protein WCP68_24490 [Enhydrobacter sp.]
MIPANGWGAAVGGVGVATKRLAADRKTAKVFRISAPHSLARRFLDVGD